MGFAVRPARAEEAGALQALIAASARALSRADYRPAQVEGALRSAFGVDSQLVRDGTYFVVEEDGQLVACGGWSYRATLFGGDSRADRDASVLDPATQPAKIRAFFVHPDHARRGIGTLLLQHCEHQALRRGYRSAELMATLPGIKLYAVRGYSAGRPVQFDVGDGEMIEFVPMRKSLVGP